MDDLMLLKTELLIERLNSEIRLQPIRYCIEGYSFMCLITLDDMKQDKAHEMFEEMVGGDPEWMDAYRYLECEKNQEKQDFAFAYGATIQEAIKNAMEIIYNNNKELAHIQEVE